MMESRQFTTSTAMQYGLHDLRLKRPTSGKDMFCAVLQEVDGPKVKGVPGLVLSRAGHLQTPLISHPALTP